MKTEYTLETLNRLFLELSQITTVKTRREIELEDLLRSACCIAERQGSNTHWDRFISSVKEVGLSGVTPRSYRILPSDQNANSENN